MRPSRKVKLHRAEGNVHIACSSASGGMSVAGGRCQERRAQPQYLSWLQRKSHFEIPSPAESSLQTSTEGKSPADFLTVAVTKAPRCLPREMMIRWLQPGTRGGLKIRPYQLFKESPGVFAHSPSPGFCDAPFISLWDVHCAAGAACLDGCVNQEQH